jgi:pimeloyl-ACP methyl ester carboxylesterase
MFTRVEFEVIADAGHWVHADQPAAFLASVRQTLLRDDQPSVAQPN